MKKQPPTWGARKHHKGERASGNHDPDEDSEPLDDPLGVYHDLAAGMIGNHHEELTRAFLRGFCAVQHAFNERTFGDKPMEHCVGVHIKHKRRHGGYCRHPLCPSCWLKRELVIRDVLVNTPAPPLWIFRESDTIPLREFGTLNADRTWEAFRARKVRSLTPLVWSLEVVEVEEGMDVPKAYDPLTNVGFRYRGIFADSGGHRYKTIPVMNPSTGAVPTPVGTYAMIYDTHCRDPDMLTEWRESTISPVKIISNFLYHAALPIIHKEVHLGRQFYAASMLETRTPSVAKSDTGNQGSQGIPGAQ